MDTGEYPVRHFELMKQIAVALSKLPAQILTHEYTCEAFGSWLLTFRYGGFPLGLIFDGRDNHLSLHKSDKKRLPMPGILPCGKKMRLYSIHFP